MDTFTSFANCEYYAEEILESFKTKNLPNCLKFNFRITKHIFYVNNLNFEKYNKTCLKLFSLVSIF